MSGYSIFLYVGTTTLVAAVVTLCAFRFTAAKIDHQESRRSRTLEGPVPGHQSLSTIGLNTQGARSNPLSSEHHGQRPITPVGPPKDSSQGLRPSNSPAQSTPPITTEGKLSSLQTIQARSAALQSDGHPGKSADTKPVYAPAIQRPQKRDSSVQEQSMPALQDSTGGPEKPEGAVGTSSSPAPAAESAGPVIAQKTPPSKRGKRAAAHTEPIETAPPGLDQSPAEASSDPGSLDLPDTLQSTPPPSSTNQDDGMPDMFAGLNEAEAGTQGLTDDLSDIDGGGLPSAARKTPQKSRR